MKIRDGILLLLVGVSLVGCESTPRKGPVPFLEGIDRIAGRFAGFADDLEKIGSDLQRMEKQRFQISPEESSMDDDELRQNFRSITTRIRRLDSEVRATAGDFYALSAPPRAKDKNGREIFKIYRRSIETLFQTLIGRKADSDAIARTPFDDRILQVKSSQSSGDTQDMRAGDLRSRDVTVLFPRSSSQTIGYLDVLSDYLTLNKLSLSGRVEATVCLVERSSSSDKKPKCTLGNYQISEILGAPGRQFGGDSGKLQNYAFWGQLYTTKEASLVANLKDALRTRNWIRQYERET